MSSKPGQNEAGNEQLKVVKEDMKTIHAVYERGVFRPLEAVELAERTEVEFEPRPVRVEANGDENLAAIYSVLSESYQTGDPEAAARHDEHQP
jgi:predicted DNA-binding antitoxin AbrB/MazE fold protein